MKKKLFLILIILIFSAYAEQNSYWDKGVDSANTLLGDIKNNLDTRINNPITGGQMLYSYDNNSSIEASITCAEEKSIMRITYSVTNGGDIDLAINEDLDLNGNYDTNFYIYGISGICTNGIIKCDRGTWNNCKYYYLNFDGSNITYSLNRNLSGCYCINNSCGSLSSTSQSKVLSDIAGVIANLIRNKYYIVSNVELDIPYAYIKGKNVNCGGVAVPVGMDESDLQTKTEEAKLNGLSDSNSTYYVVNETTQNINNNPLDSSYTSDLKTKSSEISNSANWDESSGIYSYEDNGTNVSGSMFVKNPDEVKYCEIEYQENSPDVFADESNRENSTSSSEVKKTKIIECQKDSSGNWICPVEAGESIKHDCGNINDFGEVAGAFSSINDAVNDFTCSTN